MDNGRCDSHANCTNLRGSFSCGPCPAHYTGTGNQPGGCVAINYCLTNNGGCSNLTLCVNDPGVGPMCGNCPSGYTGNGATGCKDINGLSLFTNPTLISFVGLICSECLTNNGGCDPHRTCVNTVGSFYCGSCQSGWASLTGSSVCLPDNLCQTGNGGCDLHTLCTNTIGSRTCGPCPSGYNPVKICLISFCVLVVLFSYTGNGYASCSPINVCLNGTGGCDPLTTCQFTGPGTRTCSACPKGYTGTGATHCVDINGLHADSTTCSMSVVDCLECLTTNGGCDPLTTCTNLAGPAVSCGPCPTGAFCSRFVGLFSIFNGRLLGLWCDEMH